MTGRKLGNYDILDKLGEGGMGEVWRARDARLNRSVAVKILPADVAGDPEPPPALRAGGAALGALNHPNIVAVYDVGQSEGQAYIVSELVDGESLRTVIERGPVPVRKLLDIATQTAEGIAAAHALGIIHRDLKPENIMVDAATAASRCSISASPSRSAPKGGDETATIAMSQPGMVLGTVGYMSPEQVRGEAVDARSDIFSFGCVLYEMATGKPRLPGQVRRRCDERHPARGAARGHAISGASRRDRCHRPPLPRKGPGPALSIRRRPGLRAALRFQLLQLPVGSGRPAAPQPQVARPGARGLGAAVYCSPPVTSCTPAAPNPRPPQFHRLTFREGRISSARFSPDGQNVVYARGMGRRAPNDSTSAPRAAPKRAISARRPTPSCSPSPPRATWPSSPGLSIRTAPARWPRNSLGGGQSRGLLENVLYADWSPDGSEMAIARHRQRQDPPRIPGRQGAGGREVDSPGHSHLTRWPERRLCHLRQRVCGSHRYGNPRRQRAQARRSSPARLSEPIATPLTWTRDGREIWFRSYDESTSNTIRAVDMSGKTRVVARFPSRTSLYDIAADGRLLLSADSGRVGIRAVAPGENTERDLSCLESSMLRDLTPDGRIILVNIVGESGGSKGSIYWRLTDGSPMVRLGDGFSFGISPDGKWVTGYSSRDTAQRMYVLMPTGPGEEIPVRIPPLQPTGGLVVGFLPGEGNYLVMGLFPGNKRRYFVWNRVSNSTRPISPDNMEDGMPLISPDAHRFAAPGANSAWLSCEIADGNCKPVPGLTVHDQPVGWNQDGSSLYVAMHHDENHMLMVSLVNVATG